MSELPALVGGKYRPIRLIGRGGMGLVYEVVHENTGEHLALKVLLARSRLAPDLVERFRREARATTSVKSDHVVRVTDADVAPELDGAPFLVMELLEGQNFEELCREYRPSPEESVDWLRQVARALDKAHRQRIVHRDLKPENSFPSASRGPPSNRQSSRLRHRQDGRRGRLGHRVGSDPGTPRYMAPEQAGQSGKPISPASDRYSLGLIAFRLLSGRHYFDENNVMKLLLDVAQGPTTAPSLLGCAQGPRFDAWFARACALDPGARFESCFQQIEALAEALGLSVVPAPIGDSHRLIAKDGDSERVAKLVTSFEGGPTLEASIITGRPSRLGSPRRMLLVTVAALGATAVAILFSLGRNPPEAGEGTARAPLPSDANALPIAVPEVVARAPIESSELRSNGSVTPPLSIPGAPAAAKPARAPAVSASARGRAPAPKSKPKDSIWDEP